eukprot:gnl/Chilomastix_caulleri/834.p1 GENE.gnl/Chilomastix_caulleri/834~~gnl/Chilomastix_caulleri/834.p1  ORF type:complete len:107 (+),score=18.28 gnl/Chilomastix_caulleri/834:321-641(+)
MMTTTLKDKCGDLSEKLDLKTNDPAEKTLLVAMRLLVITISKITKVSIPQQERDKAKRARTQRQTELTKQEVEEKKGVFERFAEGVKAAAGAKTVRRVPGMTRGYR